MKWPYILATAVYCAGLWWLSSQSDPPKPEINLPGLDKIVHAMLYAGLAGLVSVGLKKSDNPPGPRLQFWLPIAFAVVYGVTDELHQVFVPNRSPSAADLIADALGATCAQVFLYLRVRRQTTAKAL